MPEPQSHTISTRTRVIAFAVVLLVCLLGGGAYVVVAASSDTETATNVRVAQVATARGVPATVSGRRVLVRAADSDDPGLDGRLTVTRLGGGAPRETDLACQRVYMNGGRGLCLALARVQSSRLISGPGPIAVELVGPRREGQGDLAGVEAVGDRRQAVVAGRQPARQGPEQHGLGLVAGPQAQQHAVHGPLRRRQNQHLAGLGLEVLQGHEALHEAGPRLDEGGQLGLVQAVDGRRRAVLRSAGRGGDDRFRHGRALQGGGNYA